MADAVTYGTTPATARDGLHDSVGRGANGRDEFVSGLLRELARLRSFDGVARAARNRPPCDEPRVAAA